jgi:hypothetical protein
VKPLQARVDAWQPRPVRIFVTLMRFALPVRLSLL